MKLGRSTTHGEGHLKRLIVPALAVLLSGSVFLTSLTLSLSIFQVSTAQALQYQRVPVDPAPAVLVALRGPIVAGDFERFANFLEAMPPTDRIIGFALDSPGGNVIEAEKMAQAIKRLDASILVAEGSECSSACFLLFASSSNRYVHPDALIGVHSVRWQRNSGFNGTHHSDGKRLVPAWSVGCSYWKTGPNSARTRNLARALGSHLNGRDRRRRYGLDRFA